MYCGQFNIQCPYNSENWEDCKAFCFEERKGDEDEETEDGRSK